MNNKFQNCNMQTPSHGKHYRTVKSIICGHNKQFEILQYTAAAVPCEIDEGAHQHTTKNVEEYSYYVLMATESMSNNFKIETCRPNLMENIIEQRNP